jgi:hypothetical protein
MIIIQLPNSIPYSIGSGNAGKLLGPSLPNIPDPQTNDICICDYISCAYVEKTFASPGNEWWKNDMNEFLFKRFIAADTVLIELYKNGIKIEDLNTNAFGTFFNGFPSGSAEQQLYVGFLLEWELVYATYGVGTYQVKAQLNIIGNASTYESREFNLCLYSDVAANGTVRIESTQNGNIEGGQFDFTGLNWYQSLRIPGIFGNPTPVYTSGRYTTSTRKIVQNKDKMGNQWFLNTKLLSWDVIQVLIYNKMLANEILMTDYNIKSETVFRRIGVFPEEFDKPTVIGNPKKRYNITFVDNYDILIKRNF